jgi:hypothetical protein
LEQFIRQAAAAAVLLGGIQTFPFTFAYTGTLIVEGSADGGLSWTAFRRVWAPGSLGPFANIAALLAELNTAANWDGASLPTEFTIANTGDQVSITHAQVGAGFALRIGQGSGAVGAVSDETILLPARTKAVGSEGSSAIASVVELFTDDNGRLILVYTV